MLRRRQFSINPALVLVLITLGLLGYALASGQAQEQDQRWMEQQAQP